MSSDSDPSQQEPSSNIELSAASSSSSPSHEVQKTAPALQSLTVEETEPATHVLSSPTPSDDHDVVGTQPPTPSGYQMQAGTGRLSVLSPSHDIRRINLPSRFEVGESSHQVPRSISQLVASSSSSPSLEVPRTTEPATHVPSSPTSSDDDIQITQPPTLFDQMQAGTGQLSVLSAPSDDDIRRINLPSRFEVGESSHQVPRISQPRYQQVDEIDQLPATHGSPSTVQRLETIDENQEIGSAKEALSLTLPSVSPSREPPSVQFVPEEGIILVHRNRENPLYIELRRAMNRAIQESRATGSSHQVQRLVLTWRRARSSSPTQQPSSLAQPSVLPAPPSSPGDDPHISVSQHLVCTVCGGEIQTGYARELPSCRHIFHRACIERWSLRHDSCPTCNATLPSNLRGDQGCSSCGIIMRSRR